MADAGQQQYSRDDIYAAIRNADAAGDSASVQRLSQYLGQMDAAGGQAAAPSAQNNSWTRLPEMAGSALVKGASMLAGLPGDLTALARAGNNALNSATGLPVQDYSVAAPPTSSEINQFTHAHGLTDRPELAPQNTFERYGTAGLEAAPSIAATLASGGAAAPTIISGLAGAGAAQGAHDLAPDSSWAPVVAGLVGGLGAGGVVSKVENVLTGQAANSALGSAAARLEAAKQAAADASDAKFAGGKSLADNVSAVRAASQSDFDTTKNQLASDLAEHHAQQDAVIGGVAGQLGKSSTLQEAGEALQSHARDWLSNVLPSKLEALWAPVAAAIPKGMQLPLQQFSSALDSITKSAGDLEPLAALLKPSLPAKLASTLKAKGDLAELTADGPSSAAQGSYSWGDVSKLRSALGDAMSNPKTINDIGAQNMSKLYSALTMDMRVGADRAGAVPLFDAANEESRRLYQLAEGPMARVVSGARASAEDPAPEAAAKSLLSGAKSGATDLGALRAEIPQGVNELAAAQLRLDPKGFSKLAPEAQSALTVDPDHTATVLGALGAKQTAQEAHASGMALAQQNRAENIAAVQRAKAEGTFANAAAVRNSSKALVEAKAAHAEAQAAVEAHAASQSPPTPMTHGLLGSAVGGAAGVILPHLLGAGGNDLYHGAVGDIAGAAAPYLYRGAKEMGKNPKRLVGPALGAWQGENQLQPQR